MTTAALDNATIFIKPSKTLTDYIRKLNKSRNMPGGILNIHMNNNTNSTTSRQIEHKLLTTTEDYNYIQSLNISNTFTIDFHQTTHEDENILLLDLTDLHWLHDKIVTDNHEVYLNELFQGSQLVLPANRHIPRNEELETRCRKLQAQQDSILYKNMTKNVDCIRHNHPEDSIAFQMKQINTQLIAIVQFIVSVLVGFAFGFLGLELMIGKVDLGFRLLLGIVCALVIAIAELYFLVRKLSEDFEVELNSKHKVKVD